MFACKYTFTSYFFWNFKYAYLGDIKGGKSLNKLCYESNSPAEKEREVSSTKFRNILSLYLRSLWACFTMKTNGFVQSGKKKEGVKNLFY